MCKLQPALQSPSFHGNYWFMLSPHSGSIIYGSSFIHNVVTWKKYHVFACSCYFLCHCLVLQSCHFPPKYLSLPAHLPFPLQPSPQKKNPTPSVAMGSGCHASSKVFTRCLHVSAITWQTVWERRSTDVWSLDGCHLLQRLDPWPNTHMRSSLIWQLVSQVLSVTRGLLFVWSAG